MKKTSKIKTAGYENIYIDCPYCEKENVYNRVSDLPDNAPIAGKDIACEYCNQEFWMSGDQITNGDWHWFMNELPILKQRKEYRAYALNLCQGCECFFQLAIVNKLIDRNPNVRDAEGFLISANWNQLRKDLDKKRICELYGNSNKKEKTEFKKATFNDLRKIFLHQYASEIKSYAPKRNKPKEDKRGECFSCIRTTKVNEIRNKVVHKQAYRPTKAEIEPFDELIRSIYWVYLYLDVMDSVFIANNKGYL